VPTRLERSETNKVIAGVCGGLAEYLAIDATLVRVFFVVLGLGGIGILAYLALLIFMPLPGRPAPFIRPGEPFVSGGTSAGPADPSDPSGPPLTHPVVSTPIDPDRRRATIGMVLVAIGFLFLLGNLGFYRFVEWRYIWPLALIAFGALLLLQRTRR
jgi:phage shock protein C